MAEVESKAPRSYGIKALNGSIEGLDELLAKLDLLPEQAAMAAQDGIQKSADVIVATAIKLAPDGQIAESITAAVERDGTKVRGSVYVQQGGYRTPLWPVFVEMGTGPKGIASGGEKYPLPATAYTQHPWWYYDKQLQRPVRTSGRYAKPYLWPSYQAEKPFMLPRVKDSVRLYLAKKGGDSR